MRDEDIIIGYDNYISQQTIKKEFSQEDSETVTYQFRYFKNINTSFLIPEEIITKLRLSKLRRATFSVVIRNLLEESASPIYQGLMPKIRNKVTRSYQTAGLGLKKVSCRVHDKDLVEMDIMAQALGISRSKLLVLMLEWDELGWLGMVRALGFVRRTTSFQSLESHQCLNQFLRTYTIEIKHLTDSS
ncbi:DUF1564 family protein [Leptospira sp. 'Mane']|uniref:DUF1564 family protein n=1 Tax=Leptospira sp. 'Mane' TaxID=3387407 RepID=UPI00398ADC4D